VIVSKLSLDIGRAAQNAGVIPGTVGENPTHRHMLLYPNAEETALNTVQCQPVPGQEYVMTCCCLNL
jgi:hypothetical protein